MFHDCRELDRFPISLFSLCLSKESIHSFFPRFIALRNEFINKIFFSPMTNKQARSDIRQMLKFVASHSSHRNKYLAFSCLNKELRSKNPHSKHSEKFIFNYRYFTPCTLSNRIKTQINFGPNQQVQLVNGKISQKFFRNNRHAKLSKRDSIQFLCSILLLNRRARLLMLPQQIILFRLE